MLNDKIVESLATALSNLQLVPTFHHSALFSEDIVEIAGFQIYCNISDTSGRLVFSCHGEYRAKFKEWYYLLYKYDMKKEPKEKVESGFYPTTGSDHIADIAPGSIVKILSLIEKESDPEDMFETFIMVLLRDITKEISKWADHYTKAAKATSNLKAQMTKIYEEAGNSN